ncbi:MAG: hypothetical protein FE78DRAFT_543521 [Acidomyces sp. 'richmondensis']|nr:MAG: hypothetical protein FE78DRAFT_543521 [Acidomyces sp. 'richmondensis']
MPPHSLHLLQLLDIACFSPLKRAYNAGVSQLMRSRTSYISKDTFLLAFIEAFKQAITQENICAGFRGAGLVPFDPEAVISKLDIRIRTPTSPRRDATKTPRNAYKIEAQSTLIRERIQKRPGSSTSSTNQYVVQLSKGAQQIAYEIVLIRKEIARLRDAVEVATHRKKRKRRYI